MMIYKNASLIVCLLGMCTACVLPQSAAGQEEPQPGRALRQYIEQYDLDGDGRLSPDERTKLRDRLRRFRRPAAETAGTIDPKSTDLYKLADGPLQVAASASIELDDQTRGKKLPLRATFPEPAGKYPLIVFSHGALGSKDAYDPLVQYWAGHGYVVLQPTHGDSLSLAPARERLDLASIRQRLSSLSLAKHWNTRPQDVSFVLDNLDEIVDRIPELRGKLDRERIGVGGHSYGAHTTQLIGGLILKRPLGRRAESYADDRARALLLISPPGPGRGMTPDCWEAIKTPTLVITGTNDSSPVNGDSYTERVKTYEQLPAGNKRLLLIDGAYHGFGGIAGPVRFPGSGPASADHVYYVKSASLAFWDAQLKADARAKQFLQSGKFAAATDGKTRLTGG